MKVALTFDAEHPDHPCLSSNSIFILTTLKDRGVRATLFLQGRWASAHPAQARAIREAGHLIGSHSHYHAPMPALTGEGINIDLLSAEKAILEAAGVNPKPWFRCPFGKADSRVDFFLNKWGYKNIGWDCDGEDWKQPAEFVSSKILDTVRDGSVILLHTWPDATVKALPKILDGLKGATFVGLDELDE